MVVALTDSNQSVLDSESLLFFILLPYLVSSQRVDWWVNPGCRKRSWRLLFIPCPGICLKLLGNKDEEIENIHLLRY